MNEAGNYTKPGMRKRIFNRIKAGGKGGAPGQWSARKAQMLTSACKRQEEVTKIGDEAWHYSSSFSWALGGQELVSNDMYFADLNECVAGAKVTQAGENYNVVLSAQDGG